MDNKLIGGILVIIGTSIGGAMLALPVSTAPGGFFGSTILLFLCWALMTFSALLILEVNLWLPPEANIVSMAKATLGISGETIAWFSELLLLYALVAAYIASGSDVLTSLISLIGFKIPPWFSSILFTVIMGTIVYQGIRSVDYVNRGLMFVKLLAYAILVIAIFPHVNLPRLLEGEPLALKTAVTVAITSYGFATIVPSLRAYFNSDAKKLRIAIIIGSLVPLVCYIFWEMTILGTLPRTGENGLFAMLSSGHSTSDLTRSLSITLNKESITNFSRLFTSICVATSFLGVSLGLSDFLADGFKLIKEGKEKALIYLITFSPPLVVVLFYPTAFIAALNYAGIFCVVLLAFLPALMAWYGRYRCNFKGTYQVAGGKPALIIAMTSAIGIIILDVINRF